MVGKFKVLSDKANMENFRAAKTWQPGMEVPLLDLKAQYKTLQAEIKVSIDEGCEDR